MNVDQFRFQFPSLRQKHGESDVIYLDGPAGTQVPYQVIEAISHYYQHYNANTHGFFASSLATDDILDRTRFKVAALLGADGAHCISFGQNMTTLNFSLSKALVRTMEPGDEIVISALDHEANRGPWITLKEQGIVIREINLLDNGTLDYDDFESKLNSRTKLVCVGYASNIFGTVNDVQRISRGCKEVGARFLIDAVHYAPHFKINVQQLDCDFLLCSAYKFYGPHVGLLYSRPGLLDELTTDQLRTQSTKAPYKIETGTLNHAAIAGVEAAIDFLARYGIGQDLEAKLTHSMQQIHIHEIKVFKHLYEGLLSMDGVKIYGPPAEAAHRAPTLSFSLRGKTPQDVCKHLGSHGICAWDGHFYAIRSMEVFDLLKQGGVTRMGIVGYNTLDEVDHTLNVLAELL